MMIFPLPADQAGPCDQDASGAVDAKYALALDGGLGELKLCAHHARPYMTADTERFIEAYASDPVLLVPAEEA